MDVRLRFKTLVPATVV